MSEFGFEFTGQPFINSSEMVACPTCGKAISARSTGWFDPYLLAASANGPALTAGGYTCKEHLSEKRKEEIRKDSPGFSNFEAEKDWVDREQTEGPVPGPLESLLVKVAQAQSDPELAAGVRKVFEAAAEMR